MMEKRQYTFRSAKGGNSVTITTRMGEDSARKAAMEHFWGPAYGWCLNEGRGLHLIEEKSYEEVSSLS